MSGRHLGRSNDHEQATIQVSDDNTIRCGGYWTLKGLGGLEERLARFPWPAGSELVCDASRMSGLDTGGAVLLYRSLHNLQKRGRQIIWRGLRPEYAELLKLVSSNWHDVERPGVPVTSSWLEQIGMHSWSRIDQANKGLAFLGESTITFLRLLLAPRSLRWRVLLRNLEVDGFHALPIIGLLSFLMGVVIAYQGAEQLRTFGANIYIVDLVGISLLREIAPLVTAILVAGRSGSAYTAQIGTMKVTEELDALRTLGISPMQFLVLPRAVVLVLALPLLTVYADIVGVFGGMLIAANQLGISFMEFITRFEYAIPLKHYVIGVIKAPVFAIIIALVGCYQGFQIHGGVDSVGRHTTISVVQSIFLVIVFDAIFSVFLSWWGI